MSRLFDLPVTFVSGRAYPLSAFLEGKSEYFTVLGEDGLDMKIPLDRVSGKVDKLYISEDGTLMGSVKLLDSPMGTLCQEMKGLDGWTLKPVGVGTVDSNNVVTEYTLLYFTLTPVIQFDKEGGK